MFLYLQQFYTIYYDSSQSGHFFGIDKSLTFGDKFDFYNSDLNYFYDY